ncbi:MAG: PaaI family thioesterase [Cytophagaceae bacterium]
MTRLEKFNKDHINKPIEGSLSNITNWLHGTPLLAEKGKVVIRYTVREEWLNYQGFLHGGVGAMIMDDMSGMICMISSTEESVYSTINLVVDYLRGAKAGDVITATASIVKLGRTIAYVEGEIVNQEGQVLVKSSSNLVNVPVRV